jgi:hypothetical protein
MRTLPGFLCIALLFTLIAPAGAGTVDQWFKQHPNNFRVVDQTTDACDKNDKLTFTSTTDGNVVVAPGQTKFIRIKPTDDYTREGGYYWKCGTSNEKSRLNDALYVEVQRKSQTGAFEQSHVEIVIP